MSAARGRPPLDERREPVDDGGHDRCHRPQENPDDVRDGKEEPKEDGQAGTPEIVRDLHPDGMLLHAFGIISAPPVTRRRPIAYALTDDDSRPHLVGLAPRAERERRLLT